MEMLAFCKILWWKNGGEFTATGLPRITADPVRGTCSKAYDCGECVFLHEWLAHLVHQGWTFGWECDQCLRDTLKMDRESATLRHVQGFYQAGRKASRTPDDPEYDPDRPGLEGCTRCGWESSLLQLVIRRTG